MVALSSCSSYGGGVAAVVSIPGTFARSSRTIGSMRSARKACPAHPAQVHEVVGREHETGEPRQVGAGQAAIGPEHEQHRALHRTVDHQPEDRHRHEGDGAQQPPPSAEARCEDETGQDDRGEHRVILTCDEAARPLSVGIDTRSDAAPHPYSPDRVTGACEGDRPLSGRPSDVRARLRRS